MSVKNKSATAKLCTQNFELMTMSNRYVDAGSPEELDLPRRRQRKFRLGEDENALAPAAPLEEAQGTLA